MIRLFVFTAIFFSLISVGLVGVKTRVQELEGQLTALQTDIKNDRTAIRVLKAEWSHLNDPTRLQRLSDAYLHMSPVTTKQIASINALPFADDAPRVAERPAAPQSAPNRAARRADPELASRRSAQ